MTEEWSQLIKAIIELKPDQNLLKDYLWPIITGLLSALVGFLIAQWTIKHQEFIQLTKTKLDNGNSLALLIYQAQAKLIAIKKNYAKKLSDKNPGFNDPTFRLLSIPRMERNDLLEFKVESVIFILDNNQRKLNIWEKAITNKINSIEPHTLNWKNLSRILSMIENHNQCQIVLEKRTNLFNSIIEILSKNTTSNSINEDFLKTITPPQLLKEAIDLTELLIIMIDDLIIEMSSFLNEFPKLMNATIDTKKIRQYGTVLSFEIPEGTEFLYNERCGSVNYEDLQKILGEDDLNFITKKYKHGLMTSEK